uniref:Predicted protein n=1 Tax=Hordeum vulgare subsp. vulgare TaxID=112509 RepID=F2CUD0_HORVV|nr:predicted protein [Hordeum vulgare subsp. vulgare]
MVGWPAGRPRPRRWRQRRRRLLTSTKVGQLLSFGNCNFSTGGHDDLPPVRLPVKITARCVLYPKSFVSCNY